MRGVIIAAMAALWALAPLGAVAAEHELPSRDWSFEGVFGRYDKAALQRGFQVYREVCAACHGMRYLAFRNLTDIGISAADIKAIAAEYEVEDGPNDEGDMYTRPARPSDLFPQPYPNAPAARVANNGALPPDLNLIVKAREGGADYVYGILTGFTDPPETFDLGDGMNYNTVFPGNQIAMPPPLFDEAVEYSDGTKASVPQMAADVTEFLAWAAEPKMDERKQLGIKVILFLIVLTILLYAVKRKIWAKAH